MTARNGPALKSPPPLAARKTAGPLPSWHHSEGKHAVAPKPEHDDIARFNFLMNVNRYLSTEVAPGLKTAYQLDRQGTPEAEKKQNRHQIRKSMLDNPYFQLWSAMRRNTMEMRQQAGRSMTLRQIDETNAEVARLNAEAPERLELDPSVDLPIYLSSVDHHCMPGSYHTELVPGDTSGAANYDAGLFVTTLGALGPLADGGGRAVAAYVKQLMPDFRPKRILDMGAGLGHNVLPIAAAFPEAEVIAVDTGAPMLRYGHARSVDLGITNVRFIQADAADLDFEDGSFDWVQTTMFWHETSMSAMKKMFAEACRLLSPGGLFLNVEQPQYTEDMDPFEQFMRDWDAYYNNEPFWSAMHDVDVHQLMIDSGFDADGLIDGQARVPSENGDEAAEDFGRAPCWTVFGAVKAAAVDDRRDSRSSDARQGEAALS